MIPVNAPLLGKEELKNITDCVKSGWISSQGDYVKKFEAEFAKFCNMKYGVSVVNGTAAIHLALAALDIGKGDEVILPTFTMIATIYAVMYTGATPVLVDCEDRTWNMDTSKIERLITSKTKAILPVHIYGHPVNMGPILKLAKKYKLFIVEDAAEAHGAKFKNKVCGSLSDIACFSFYANKIITTGEGGIVVTNNKKLADKAKMLKDLSHSPKKRFLHAELAYNYRMTNMQAAIGLAQLKKINSFIKIKRKMASLYYSNLKNIKGLRLPIEEEWAKNVYWMYAILVEDDFPVTRDELRSRLLKKGIGTRDFFIPMHKQPAVRKIKYINKSSKYPVSDYISARGLYLPSGLALKAKDVLKVCSAIKDISGNS